MIGTQVERQGIIRHGAKMISAVSEANVPKLSVIVRKAYGAGLYAMAGPAFDPDYCLALPTASIAVMGPQAAINAVYYNQLQAIEDAEERAARVEELRREYAADIDILHLASELVVDAVVEPDELRGPSSSGAWRTPPASGASGRPSATRSRRYSARRLRPRAAQGGQVRVDGIDEEEAQLEDPVAGARIDCFRYVAWLVGVRDLVLGVEGTERGRGQPGDRGQRPQRGRAARAGLRPRPGGRGRREPGLGGHLPAEAVEEGGEPHGPKGAVAVPPAGLTGPAGGQAEEDGGGASSWRRRARR